MKKKTSTLADAGRQLGDYFLKEAEELRKSVSSHEAQSTHHSALANFAPGLCRTPSGDARRYGRCTRAQGSHGQGAHFHIAASEHHEALHKVHQAMAEKCKVAQDALKALASEWGATSNDEQPVQ
jgi:hypothetical protein